MIRFAWLGATAAALLVSILPGPAAETVKMPDLARQAEANEPNPVQIGMVQTLFHDVPTPIVKMLTPPFRGLMKEFTGLNGEVAVGGHPLDVAGQLADKKLHLAVFHGVEFAWAQKKHPDLRPLMVAINKHRTVKALLVVAQDGADALSALKGKKLGMPLRTKEHCRLFLDKSCAAFNAEPKVFFGEVARPLNPESALDAVLDGTLAAAAVDDVAWDNYGDVKPGCQRRLRVLCTSEAFPAAVVAYRVGHLAEATLEKFRKGMISANRNERGRELMNLWRISAFEPIPADYERSIADILKSYPSPTRVDAVPVSRSTMD